MSELSLLQSSQGVWEGLHRVWTTPAGSGVCSPSQALVLASVRQAAVVVALRWCTGEEDFYAVLMVRATPGGPHRFVGRWCGSHPQTPQTLTVGGGASTRDGIIVHSDGRQRPWEITVGRSSHEIALAVYDGAGCRPELPVMHATYPTQLGSLPWAQQHPPIQSAPGRRGHPWGQRTIGVSTRPSLQP